MWQPTTAPTGRLGSRALGGNRHVRKDGHHDEIAHLWMDHHPAVGWRFSTRGPLLLRQGSYHELLPEFCNKKYSSPKNDLFLSDLFRRDFPSERSSVRSGRTKSSKSWIILVVKALVLLHHSKNPPNGLSDHHPKVLDN